MTTSIDDISYALGEIRSDLKHIKQAQNDQGERIEAVDSRLAAHEKRAATIGGGAGTLMGIFTSVIAWNLKGSIGG